MFLSKSGSTSLPLESTNVQSSFITTKIPTKIAPLIIEFIDDATLKKIRAVNTEMLKIFYGRSKVYQFTDILKLSTFHQRQVSRRRRMGDLGTYGIRYELDFRYQEVLPVWSRLDEDAQQYVVRINFRFGKHLTDFFFQVFESMVNLEELRFSPSLLMLKDHLIGFSSVFCPVSLTKLRLEGKTCQKLLTDVGMRKHLQELHLDVFEPKDLKPFAHCVKLKRVSFLQSIVVPTNTEWSGVENIHLSQLEFGDKVIPDFINSALDAFSIVNLDTFRSFVSFDVVKLQKAQQLKVLDLSCCGITNDDIEILSQFQLRELYLDYNELGPNAKLNLIQATELETLTLRFNRLKSINSLKYSNFPKLKELNLQNSHIEDDSLETLVTLNVPKLRRLYLSWNVFRNRKKVQFFLNHAQWINLHVLEFDTNDRPKILQNPLISSSENIL